jgi:hypothetical protein
VRWSQIALPSRIASYSSTDFGIESQNFLASAVKRGGTSSASPPTWKYRVCMRVPPTISDRSRMRSRSSNV